MAGYQRKEYRDVQQNAYEEEAETFQVAVYMRERLKPADKKKQGAKHYDQFCSRCPNQDIDDQDRNPSVVRILCTPTAHRAGRKEENGEGSNPDQKHSDKILHR